MLNDSFFLRPFRGFRIGLCPRSPVLPLLLLLQALTGCGGEEPGAPVSRSAQLALDEPAYRDYLSTLTVTDREQIRSSRKNMMDMALDLHAESALAADAEAQGLLDRRPEIAARLQRARRAILSNALLGQVMQHAKIPGDPELEALAQERYLRSREQYAIPERRRVAHILLTRPEYCPCETEAPEDLARQLRSRLDAGEDFAELARAHSHDPTTAKRGGELKAWVQRDGKMVPAFEDAVFALKTPGQVSAPVRTPYGIHLIRLLEIEEARVPPFEELRARIKAQVVNDIRSSAAENLRSVRNPDPGSIDFGALESLIDKMREATPVTPSPSTKPAALGHKKDSNPAVQPSGDRTK